ncbi:MAG: glycoside hydrolase family 2 TIM barrel-domain containing protein, partial [Syntrophothermus sp.]
MKAFLAVLALFLLSACTKADDVIKSAGEQLIKKDKILNGRFPVYTDQGKWTFSEKPNWFSGFTAGELWYMYDMTGNAEFRDRALKHADNLIQFAELDNTHDLGFIFLNSCVKAYEHTGDIKYRDAAVKAAAMLMRRFNEKGNFIRAWGKLGTDDRAGLMIMDTMMNLELLFWAAKVTGDYKYYDIAYKHALTCLAQHVRNNYSTYHVVEFDPATGKVIKKRTHQGYSDESTWARGQAWGIYGFAIAYRYTHNEKFLNVSEKLADYFINKLPEDMVPYWDLDLKGENVVRDASAGAIAASGMYLMSELASGRDMHIKYRELADKITASLKNKYTFLSSKRGTEEGILLHTVYNYAKNWGIDESFPCGDFYFTECLYKENNLLEQENLIENKKERQEILINRNWYYLEDNMKEESSLYQSAVNWQKVDLPHTWNRFDALDQVPGYRRDAGWYEKDIFVPETINDQRVVLYFEGVNLNCEVYVNGKKAGGHTGGFTGFETDITDYVKKAEKNLIRVRADNSYDINIVPSQKSDFVVYGGITRNVWLCIRPGLHLNKMMIQTPAVTEKKAEARISFIISDGVKDKQTEVSAVIKDPAGKIVSSSKIELEKGENRGVLIIRDIKNPKLWSPDSPVLYTAELTLSAGGKVHDKISDRFGCRWYEFKEKGAFYLNGKRLLLRGTHRHEELSGMGNALPDSVHRNDIKMIKEMGANFVRLAHYPQAPEVYRACDELGLLVWDENPWCRGGMGGAEWQANTKNIFREMIMQNYNHPSIILWSIGNESDWMPDFPGGDNTDSLKAFAAVLNRLAKELDPYRYTTTRKFPQAAGVVDVFSPSIWSGWYSDIYSNYEKSLKKA